VVYNFDFIIDFGWGSAPDPAGGAYSAPQTPLAGLKGPTFKRRGDKKRGGKNGRKRGEEGKGREREGREKEKRSVPRSF